MPEWTYGRQSKIYTARRKTGPGDRLTGVTRRRRDRGGRRSKRNGAEENSERRRAARRLGEVEVGLDLYAGRYCGRLETPLRKRT